MQKELLQLFSRVSLPPSPAILPLQPATTLFSEAFNLEVASFGYTLSPNVLAVLELMDRASFETFRFQTVKLLNEITGGSLNHEMLFVGFPYDRPDLRNVLIRKILNIIGLRAAPIGMQATSRYTALECGHVIDADHFDISQYGACPICERQVAELSGTGHARHEFSAITPLKLIELADDAFLASRAQVLLSRPSSLSEAEKSLLLALASTVALEKPEQVFKETLPIAYQIFTDDQWLISQLSGATDILRIATYLSDPTADLSLASNTRFKLAKRDCRRLLTFLEAFGSGIAEDLVRHREKWLRLGEVLHPSQRIHKGRRNEAPRYPKTSEAFMWLRGAPGAIDTYTRAVEKGLRFCNVTPELLTRMATRPGSFLRNLDWAMRMAPEPQLVIDALATTVKDVPTQRLYDLLPFLTSRIRRERQDRVFFPKGATNKIQIVPDRRPDIPDVFLGRAFRIVSDEIEARARTRVPMGSVFIDPTLQNVLLPFNRRGDSASSGSISKGSRYPLGDAPVLRLFVHWTGQDVDLSLGVFDADFRMIDQVSWTKLQSDGLAHSGDIQSAPRGASEFIDIDKAIAFRKTKERGQPRYYAMMVLSFRGGLFSEFPCFAGVMERDALRSGMPFEPASVRWKLDINAPGRTHLPLLFDIIDNVIIPVDVMIGSRSFAAIHRQESKMSMILKSIVGLPDIKPTVYDVLAANAVARGRIVHDPARADRIYDLSTLDIDAIISDCVD